MISSLEYKYVRLNLLLFQQHAGSGPEKKMSDLNNIYLGLYLIEHTGHCPFWVNKIEE